MVTRRASLAHAARSQHTRVDELEIQVAKLVEELFANRPACDVCDGRGYTDYPTNEVPCASCGSSGWARPSVEE